MKLPALFLLGLLTWGICHGQDACRWRIAFWNVENYFDTQHDTLKEDYAFTPKGDNHWTNKRYLKKRNNIYKVIVAMQCPAVVGMAEIENDWVLQDLCKGTPLRKYHYQYIHYDSPDARGVDCALLYRQDMFKVLNSHPICVSDSAEQFYTRDILLVHGVLQSKEAADSCFLLVNHWPSKLGGATADYHRLRIAHLLLSSMDSLQHAHPGTLVLAMGDFNASAIEEAISQGMEFYGQAENSKGLFNLTYGIPKGTGSYKYQDTWSCIDQMFANRKLPLEIFYRDYLLTDDTRYMGKKLFRTYTGMKYLGGFSDHLPIIVSIL